MIDISTFLLIGPSLHMISENFVLNMYLKGERYESSSVQMNSHIFSKFQLQ